MFVPDGSITAFPVVLEKDSETEGRYMIAKI